MDIEEEKKRQKASDFYRDKKNKTKTNIKRSKKI